MKKDIIYQDLSFILVGLLYQVHNELGRFCREKQYGDRLEEVFRGNNIDYKREFAVEGTGNRLDFLFENKIVLEIKAKDTITREDYRQTQRYLQSTSKKLGLLVNFRQKSLYPKRIVRIDTKQKIVYTDQSE
jgi:GxxExxY protein